MRYQHWPQGRFWPYGTYPQDHGDAPPDAELHLPSGDRHLVIQRHGGVVIPGAAVVTPQPSETATAAGQDASAEVQRGELLRRLPDVFAQPEHSNPIDIRPNPVICSFDFTTPNIWIPISRYEIYPNRKLVITDASVSFSNPYISGIVSARVTSNDAVVPIHVRVQEEEYNYPMMRAAIVGQAVIQLEIKRTTAAAGWIYGSYDGSILGWEVDDSLDSSERFYK